jgi:predicted PurR-regulated permease PerM
MDRRVEISQRTIIFTVLLLLGIVFLYLIWDILLLLAVAILITVILSPTVKKLNKKKVPKGISVLVVYFGAIGLLIIGIAGILPPVIDQTTSFLANFDTYLKQLGVSAVVLEQVNTYLFSQLGSLSNQALRFGVDIFNNFIEIITVLIFAFYLLVTRDKIDQQFASLLGDKKSKRISDFIDKLEIELGGWARGQLVLMIIVGLSTYIGLVLLGVPYALPLAVLAGLLEVVPYVGPIIAAVPAVVIGFGVSPFMGWATVALYFLVQQIEAYVFVPKVMEKSIGLHPVLILMAIAIGFRLGGVLGIFMSVPMLIGIKIFYYQFIHKPQQ